MLKKVTESGEERRAQRLVIDEPFPLRHMFRTRILPGLFVFVLGATLLAGYGAQLAIKLLYLEFAQQRAQGIALAVENAAPQAWEKLLNGEEDRDNSLRNALNQEMQKLGLLKLRIFRLDGAPLFASDGSRPDSVFNEPAIVELLDSGEKVYKIIVTAKLENQNIQLGFEMFEPVGYLDDLLLRNTVLPMAAPGVMLLLLVLALTQLVLRAQNDIDLRTMALISMRKRLETLVSEDAVSAVHNAGDREDLQSRRLTTTLVYTDVRDFTGFSEVNTPEDVIGFLNDVIALQLESIAGHGGDVDKMIGDAVLARFDGEGRSAEALAAAQEIQARLSQRDVPRGLGIGVFTGEVVTGPVGAQDRRDYTIIGDSVNVVARLSSLALSGEIVVDADSARQAGIDTSALGDAEAVTVKGRDAPISVHRWAVVGDSPSTSSME
ncbi:MAG: adenylate/guanylate cyclase domain-containing protein [Magnetospiraceae bacterium]